MDRMIRMITDYIFVSDEPREADIIFLPGGTAWQIPETGAELYRRGASPLLLASGKYTLGQTSFVPVNDMPKEYSGNYGTECDFYRAVLKKRGVPDGAVLGEDKAEYTMQNARYSRALCDSLGINVRRAIICCRPYHAARCLMYYTMSFPEADISVCPADCGDITAENWYTTKIGFETVMNEVEKTGVQLRRELGKYLGIGL